MIITVYRSMYRENLKHLDLNIIPNSYKCSLQATADHYDNFMHGVQYIICFYCRGKHSIAMIMELQNAISVIQRTLQLYIYYCIQYSWSVFDYTVECGSSLTTVVMAHLSVLLNTSRGIGSKSCIVNNVFPPDDICCVGSAITKTQRCNGIHTVWMIERFLCKANGDQNVYALSICFSYCDSIYAHDSSLKISYLMSRCGSLLVTCFNFNISMDT